MSDPGFDTGTGWTFGGNWTLGSGVASHTSAGATQDYLSQAVALDDGANYRWAYHRTGSTNGTGPRFNADSDVVGPYSSAADAIHYGTQAAPTNTVEFGIVASTFAGSVDDVVLFKETPACLTQGAANFWIAPVSQSGTEGAPVGPYSLTIP